MIAAGRETPAPPTPSARRRPIAGVRWYIGGLLFASTVINYIDRQTLSVLAPYLKADFHWTNTDFAFIVIAFRAAYSIGQAGAGRMLDRLGTRAGLTIGVIWYSVAAMLTALATGFWSFCGFRFLLGAGEAANWPGATKAVSEWFPRRESGWAVALFDSGSSIGGALAPLLVLGLHRYFGTWRPAFVITGALGFAWLLVFRRVYRLPEVHPRISDEERALILADRDDSPTADATAPVAAAGAVASAVTGAVAGSSVAGSVAGTGAGNPGRPIARPGYRELLALPQTWAIILGKTLTDPVWFFITDWFAIYLVSRGFRLEDSLLAFWVPFLAADAGNFIGGGLSSTLIRRGWSVGAARRLVIVGGGIGMSGLAVSLMSDSLAWLTTWFAISTLAYAALSTIVLNLPADLYPTHSVASVSGLSGSGAGLGTIAATLLTGIVADRYSFAPILIGASLVPLVASTVLFLLIRNGPATERGLLRRI
jgi:ACS family hexuronate transporter-like MFS transporter